MYHPTLSQNVDLLASLGMGWKTLKRDLQILNTTFAYEIINDVRCRYVFISHTTDENIHYNSCFNFNFLFSTHHLSVDANILSVINLILYVMKTVYYYLNTSVKIRFTILIIVYMNNLCSFFCVAKYIYIYNVNYVYLCFCYHIFCMILANHVLSQR